MREYCSARWIVCAIVTAVICIGFCAFSISARAQQCTFTPSPAVVEAGHSGGTYTINFSASGSTCNWVVSSSDNWITVPATHRGTGSGSVTVTVKPNPGAAARQGRIDFNRQYIWVNQPGRPPCIYKFTSTSRTLDPGSGQASFHVMTDPGCAWSVSNASPWLSIAATQAQNRSGSGSVTVRVYTNTTGTSRTGTLTIAGQTLTVTQEACTYSVSPSSLHPSASSGGTSLNITTNDKDCPWTVEGVPAWITVPGESSGKGNGTVQLQFADNRTGAQRAAWLKVKNITVNVIQKGQSCTYKFTSTSRTLDPGSGQASFHVTTDPGCAWSVSNVSPWLSIAATQAQNRSGSGSVTVRVYSNTSATSRTGTLTIAGQTLTVTQEACTYSVSPSPLHHSASSGGTGLRIATNHKDCPWTIEETAGWISIGSSDRSGKGTNTVQVRFADNHSTAQRSAVIKVKNISVNVTQDGKAPSSAGQSSTRPPAKTDPTSAQASGEAAPASRSPATKASATACSYALSKSGQNMGPGDGKGSFSIKTDNGCDWKASANSPWISITSGSSGKGKGMVKFAVQENRDGSPRTGQITVAGQSFTITQKGQKAGGKTKGHR